MPVEDNILNMIKFERKHIYTICSDIFTNAYSTKNIFNQIINGEFWINDKSNYLNGFIQEISLDPYGLLLVCNIQVILIFRYSKIKNN